MSKTKKKNLETRNVQITEKRDQWKRFRAWGEAKGCLTLAQAFRLAMRYVAPPNNEVPAA